MNIQELRNKHIVIMGYGKEGASAEAYIRTHYPDAHITIADQKDGEDYLNKQYDADIVIKSPGIPKRLITVPYTTPTNIFFANANNEIIGVTGTKGKSTTASLIYHILKTAGKSVTLAGNIGIPMLTELLRLGDTQTLFVCELSSYQLDDLQYSPHISVILNLFPEHMNYHGDVHAYYQAKKQIIARAGAEDYLVYNPTFPLLRDLASHATCKVVPYIDDLPVYPDETSLQGEHNRDNMRAASTVAGLYQIGHEIQRKAFISFRPLPHRLEFIGEYADIRFYDDAISTTPESTIQAIKTLRQVGTIMLGGQDRGYDFTELANTIGEYQIPTVIVFPDSGKNISRALQSRNLPELRIFETDSMEEAVRIAYQHTPTGSICLLSCASPSYSLWKNFEEKGDEFKKYVQLLAMKPAYET